MQVMSSSSDLPAGHVRITEGTATMIYDEKEAVFYNRVQVLNRDLSIQVIRLFAETREREKRERYNATFARYQANPSEFTKHAPIVPVEGISILDALAATGLRSVRYLVCMVVMLFTKHDYIFSFTRLSITYFS